MSETRTIRTLIVAALMLAAAVLIAACGGGDTVGGGSDEKVTTAKGGKPTGEVTISSWPGYIDPGKNGTVAEFEERYGVDVSYIEDITSNVQFFGKLQPQLDQGQSGERSLFVVTDWLAKQMYDLGYLEEFSHDDLQTVFENILPAFEKSESDPGRKFSIPWQGGLTGIWVDTAQAPEIRSIEDLFDPKYKGRITFLDEMRDTVPLVMQYRGIDPSNASKQEWLDTIAFLKDAADSGQIRRFADNSYTEDLTSGNVVAAIGWSGDASLIGRESVEWRKPTDACDTFFDQMVIPVGAPNTAAALAFMNFVYRPEVQADIAAYVNYVTPVAGVQEILVKRDPELGNNELIFPPPSLTRGCSADPNPPGSAQDQQDVTEAFQDVVTG
ncbi:MAG: spermidine/putrescine ABC transporter substrate-binding protein [Actinomycetota bacterium]